MVFLLIVGASLALSFALAAVRLWRAYQQGHGQGSREDEDQYNDDYNTVLIALGGCVVRELYAANLATNTFQKAHVYMTSGELLANHESLVPLGRRVTVDRSAVDTVSNFTSLYYQLLANGTRTAVVLTSKNHMRRASSIAYFVLGHAGIRVHQHVVPNSDYPPIPEPLWQVVRDLVRAWVWVLTGWDGRSVALLIHSYRDPDRANGLVTDVEQ